VQPQNQSHHNQETSEGTNPGEYVEDALVQLLNLTDLIRLRLGLGRLDTDNIPAFHGINLMPPTLREREAEERKAIFGSGSC
jgi:hypothetical protein